MTLNPYTSAILALAYIGCVAGFMRFIESTRHDTPDTFFDGLGFLSLFVLSVATMAFLFFYQPVVLLIEARRSEALTHFLKTLGTFSILTICALVLASLQ